MTYIQASLDHPFLAPLQDIPTPPSKLYLSGQLPDCQPRRPKCVAVIGSRKYSSYGHRIAYEIASQLASLGVVIISGLAYGIDTIAHRACLDVGGITIAVLGTSLSSIYPRRHLGVAQELAKTGALLSEYAADDPFYPTNFLARNRIISGLADAIVVVEAAEHSGTLSTASHALAQGRELFAVPGDLGRPTSIGCLKLIEQGAHVYRSTDDLLSIIDPHHKRRSPATYHGQDLLAQKIISLLQSGYNDGDQIILELRLSPAIFNQKISLLELNNVVHALGNNKWALAC